MGHIFHARLIWQDGDRRFAMIVEWRQEPVVLERDGLGTYRVVRNTREAAEYLLDKWLVHDER